MKQPRKIAPHLSNGAIRDNFRSQLPGDIKDILVVLAMDANTSVSWTLENILIEYFNLDVKYKKKKKKNGKA